MANDNILLSNVGHSKRGAEVSKNFLRDNSTGIKALIGGDMRKYRIEWDSTYLPLEHKEYKRLSSFFNESLIFLRRVDSCLEATISVDGCYAFNKNVCGIRVEKLYDPKFVLAWLNSKAVDFYYKKKFSTKKDGAFPEIQAYLYEQLPIPACDKITESKIVNLVNFCLTHPYDETIAKVENNIDEYIYHLYNLTYDEVLVIDPDTPITREEYEPNQTSEHELCPC